MLVLHRPEPGGGATAALFGLGLLGGRIAGSLRAAGYAVAAGLPFSWGSPPGRKDELAAIRDVLAALPGRLDVLWSAGKGGFGMDRAQADREYADFCDVLDLSRSLAADRPGGGTRFHLVSSAGGLFEGQRHVTPRSLPAPRRPYGELKLRQERALAAAGELCGLVYRPSSVFGLPRSGGRMGLIPTLLANGARYRVTTIFGAPDTLRDYVTAGDVARYVARRMGEAGGSPGTVILASCRPVSLSGVLAVVERVLARKAFLTYRPDPSDNTAHITFSPETQPPDWRPEGLDTAVRQVWNALLSGLPEGVAGPHDMAVTAFPAVRACPGF